MHLKNCSKPTRSIYLQVVYHKALLKCHVLLSCKQLDNHTKALKLYLVCYCTETIIKNSQIVGTRFSTEAHNTEMQLGFQILVGKY